jgi:hypothetical protein
MAAERGESKCLIATGKLLNEYLFLEMDAQVPRESAVVIITGRLAEKSTGVVNAKLVNSLVASYHAFRLLSPDGMESTVTAWGNYRDCWSQLVERDTSVPHVERWTILPGYETQCQALFVDCTNRKLKRDSLLLAVKQLRKEYADYQRKLAIAETEAKRQEQLAAEATSATAKAEAAEAAEAAAAAKAAADAESDAVRKAELTAKAESERQAMLAKQRAERDASAAKEQADRDAAKAAKAEAEAKRQVDVQTRKLDEQINGKPKTGPRPATAQGEPRRDNPVGQLIATAKGTATPKDLACMVWDIISEHVEPESVLEALMTLAKMSGKLSKPGEKACQAYLIRSGQRETVAA